MQDELQSSLALARIMGNNEPGGRERRSLHFVGTTYDWPADPVIGIVEGVAFLFKQLCEDSS